MRKLIVERWIRSVINRRGEEEFCGPTREGNQESRAQQCLNHNLAEVETAYRRANDIVAEAHHTGTAQLLTCV